MTYPVDIYSCASGQSIYGGKHLLPAWRQLMSAGSVALIPGNTLASIDPQNNASVNQNYPGAAPWRGITGQPALISAWGGMAFDDARGRAWMPLQGGHGDYAGNEPYFADLMQDTVNWVMVRKPSGALGMTPVPSYIDNSTVNFSDGRLRPAHSYNNNIYVPGIGPMVTRQGGAFPDGTNDQDKVYKIDETTGEATMLCDHSVVSLSTKYGGAVYDAANHRILSTGVGNTNLVSINTNTWAASTAVSNDNYVDGYAKLLILPSLDLLAVFQGGGPGYPAKFYLRERSALPTMIQPTITGTMSAGLGLNGTVGAAWDDVNQQFYLWNNTSNTNEITVLKPSGNPRTAPWLASVRAFSGVTVSSRAYWGTWGRFGYSPILKGCYLINATNEQFHFFATE